MIHDKYLLQEIIYGPVDDPWGGPPGSPFRTSSGSLATPIPWLDKRHGCQDGLSQLVSDVHLDFGSLLVEPSLNVCHSYVLRKRRRRNTRCHGTLLMIINEEGDVVNWLMHPPMSSFPEGSNILAPSVIKKPAYINALSEEKRRKHTPCRSAFNDQTYATPGRTILQMFHDPLSANEVASFASFLSCSRALHQHQNIQFEHEGTHQ